MSLESQTTGRLANYIVSWKTGQEGSGEKVNHKSQTTGGVADYHEKGSGWAEQEQIDVRISGSTEALNMSGFVIDWQSAGNELNVCIASVDYLVVGGVWRTGTQVC